MFSQLRKISLEKALEIMAIKLDPEHKDFAKLMARQTAIMTAVVTATTRIEATALRGRVRTKFDEILTAISEEEKRQKLN